MPDDRPAAPFRVISAGTDGDATLVRAGATRLMSLSCTNINAAVRYLKLYNKATAPTVGTDTPALTYAVPGATTGDGIVVNVPVNGIIFPLGLGVGLVTGAADTVTTSVAAGELIINGSFNSNP